MTHPFKLAPSSGKDIDETTQWAEISLINEFTVSGKVTMVGDGAPTGLWSDGDPESDGSDNDTLTDASGLQLCLTSGSKLN